MEQNDQIHFMTDYLIETWREITEYLIQHPEKLTTHYLNHGQAYFDFCQAFLNDQKQTKTNDDKRFQAADWQHYLVFHFIQRSYQFFYQQSDALTDTLHIENEKIAQKLRFYSRRFLDSISPSNFMNMNPEVLSKIAETNGVNLIQGFKQFQADLKDNQFQFRIKLTDESQFELGNNIACTPGKIIYQNDLMQLIQYTAVTEKVYQHPLLIIPPWINKYYILDLQQENSFVKWLVDQGHTVFMISWVNPSRDYQNKKFLHYLLQGPLAALKVIKQVTKNQPINLLGYCTGGTLLACLLAYLAQKKNTFHLISATFLTTMLDFSEPGELGVFIDEKQVAMLEKHMKKRGYLDGNFIASVFNILRANDLIWAAFVNHYLKGQKPKAFDLLYWNADSTHIPALTHQFYLRNFYLNNGLIQPGKIKLNNVSLDLNQINLPSYFLAAHDDHIVPWASCYRSQQFLRAATKFVLTASGHVAGVVNPPNKKKYGYWTKHDQPKTAEQFLATATFHAGSWWPDWADWLKKYAGEWVTPDFKVDALDNAPGSYVKVRLTDIARSEAKK